MLRLLDETSNDKEAEEMVIQKLKLECGITYINKMIQMINDVKLSEDLTKDFSAVLSRGSVQTAGANVDLKVKVLTYGNWPIEGEPPACFIPK